MEKIVFTNIETWCYKRYIRVKEQRALQRDSCGGGGGGGGGGGLGCGGGGGGGWD